METNVVQQKIEAFLEELGVPGFLLFGFQKPDGQFGVVYSSRKAPPPVVVKSMTWALHDYVQKNV
jgi:hypothetical protein